MSDLFLVGASPRVNVAHQQRGRHSIGKILFVVGQANDQRNYVVVYVVVGIEVQQLCYRIYSPFPHHCFVVGAQVLKIGEDQSMLVSQQGSNGRQLLSDGEDNLVVLFLG